MLPDRAQEALHRIDSHGRPWLGASTEGTAGGHTPSGFMVNSLIEEAIASSQLEGASTTRAVAAEMIRAGRRPRDRSEQMILNNYRAMEAVRRLQDEPLTEQAVLNLHAVLTVDTLDDPDDAGRLQLPSDRRVHVWDNRDQTLLHSPPPADELPGRTRGMVQFANHGLGDGPFLRLQAVTRGRVPLHRQRRADRARTTPARPPCCRRLLRGHELPLPVRNPDQRDQAGIDTIPSIIIIFFEIDIPRADSVRHHQYS